MKFRETEATITIIGLAVISLALLFAQTHYREAAQTAESHVEQLEVELHKVTAEAQALQDSVLAGEIEGFGLRCYLVRED